MNSVCLTGTIKTEIRCTYTQKGACRASFILAVPRRLQTNTKCSPRGQPSQSDVMLRIVAWDAMGEKARDFGAVNERAEVEGWIDVWKSQNGDWQTDIKAEYINFPDRGKMIKVNEEVKKDVNA
ncbi:MAG: single-stranded DNA-binding protein [Schwartzia succinivorans]|uniref:single-stranded DNA-binding protein n=1 Tax=Schwartzia succinivorans TaxID=55507 RepID=UPI0023560391|nr:single-stranded DNA-binding protein [Schwartzia succinivorans]MBE6098258.1 single-stranded DNA-binding protein [Schwartzia succinivorans]